MESKESARLKDINTQLKGIEVQLRGQNKILKELVDQIIKIADVFDKQWHGDANATSNDNKVVAIPFTNIDTAFANLKKGIENAVDEMKRQEQN